MSYIPTQQTRSTSSSARTAENPGRRELTDDLTLELTQTEDPDRAAAIREQLVELNMPVAEAIASRYHHRGVATEDLHQVAYLALVNAARRFDPHAGHAFLSFAVPTIRGEVRRYFRDFGWMVRPPRSTQELQLTALRTRSELQMTWGREPTPEEVATALEEDPAAVREALAARGCFSPTSLDLPAGEGSATLGDLLGGEDAEHDAVDARVMLGPVVRDLRERDRLILELRFFHDLTQREVAERLGVTQMQVSRLLSRIYRDLRRGLEEPQTASDVGAPTTA